MVCGDIWEQHISINYILWNLEDSDDVTDSISNKTKVCNAGRGRVGDPPSVICSFGASVARRLFFAICQRFSSATHENGLQVKVEENMNMHNLLHLLFSLCSIDNGLTGILLFASKQMLMCFWSSHIMQNPETLPANQDPHSVCLN